jgi:hypothetical protein
MLNFKQEESKNESRGQNKGTNAQDTRQHRGDIT